MATFGKLFENDGQITVFPSWFNNLFRMLKFYFRAGWIGDDESTIGTLSVEDDTRVNVVMPSGDDEFVFSAGQFMAEAHQAYVDFNEGDDAGAYNIVVDAKRNTGLTCPRFEIWIRKVLATDDEDELNNTRKYLHWGRVYWDGAGINIIADELWAIRRASRGIFDFTSLYRGPLALREAEIFTLGDLVRVGGEIDGVGDWNPNEIVGAEQIRALLGMMSLLLIGRNSDIKVGDNSVIELLKSVLRITDDGELELINAELSISGRNMRLSNMAIDWLHTSPGAWAANRFGVDSFVKVSASVQDDGTLDYGRGISSVDYTAPGQYQVNFTQAFANALYRPYVQPLTSFLNVKSQDRQTTHFSFALYSTVTDNNAAGAFVIDVFGEMQHGVIPVP